MSQLVLAEGAVFAERYRVIRCIAQGGMGAVYEVVHIKTNKHRALKVMLPNMVEAEGMLERFEQEARVTSDIESEFIVEVLDAGIDAATRMPFMVMELLRGEDLNRRLKRVKRMSAGEVLILLRQVSTALDKTHKASIVHRDLKPENLFLTERDDGSPRIKILDFGVAKLLSEGATSAGATQSLGTPLFMAPEQFNTSGTGISAATDIYALGLIAYKLLVGLSYWQEELKGGANLYAFVGVALQGIREAATERARRAGVGLPLGFDAWFAKACALNPRDRFGSAKEAVEALSEVFGEARETTGLLSAVPKVEAPESGDDARTLLLEKGSSDRVSHPRLQAETAGSGLHTLKGQAGLGLTRTASPRLERRGIWKGAVVAVGMVIGAVGVWVGSSALSDQGVNSGAEPGLDSTPDAPNPLVSAAAAIPENPVPEPLVLPSATTAVSPPASASAALATKAAPAGSSPKIKKGKTGGDSTPKAKTPSGTTGIYGSRD